MYEIGGLYFVRDGNHRVSVAKSRGCEMIDAEVISLQSEIKLKAGMSKNKILKTVVEYEKREFYSETNIFSGNICNLQSHSCRFNIE